MRNKFILLLLLFSACFSKDKPNETEKHLPQISFSTMFIDKDTVEANTQITYEFPFKNTGTDTLIISSVKSSCGCVSPSWNRRPIPPGESDVITALFNTKGKIGVQHKTLTVQSNATLNPIVLRLKAFIRSAE